MKTIISKQTQDNIANLMSVSCYERLVVATEADKKHIISCARKKAKMKIVPRGKVIASGSPYVMLGLKVNNKGRYV